MRAALLLPPLLLLCGCRQPEPSRPEAAPTKLRFVFRAALSNAPIVIAEEEGFFRRQRLEVELVVLRRNQDGLPALMEGGLDIIAGSVNPAYFNAIGRGAQIRVVADLGHLDPAGCTYAALVAKKELLREGRLVAPGPSRKRRVALRRGSTSEFILERALERDRIDPARVDVEFLPASAKVEALQAGAYDVVLGLGADLDRMLRAGSGSVWHSAQSLAPDFQFLIVVYGPRLLREDPEAGRRFMLAYLEAVRQYNEGKTERNLALLERRLGIDRETLMHSCWVPIRADGRINAESLLQFQAWARSKGLVERPLGVEEFWDPRFARQAAQELGLPRGSQ